MKPLNINKETGTNTSSNLIVWQGPDIKCIGLCKGATVTEVVHELATQLCGVLETLDVSKYDLTCLNITTCPPETFTELLSLLIERLCEVISTPCPPCEDGANGNYIVTAYEPAGENCEFGGVSITTYNGTTNLPIVGSVVYVCNGEDGNDGQTGNTGGPGTPGKRGDRGLNGNYVVQTEEPAGANCECGGIKFEVKDGLTDAVISTEYACTPCVEYGLDTFQCLARIASSVVETENKTFPIVAVTGVNPIGLNKAKIIKKYQQIISNGVIESDLVNFVDNVDVPACNFGTFDNETLGEFTITQAGHYLINGSCHLKSNSGGTASWQTTGVGKFGMAILSSFADGNDIYSGQSMAVVTGIDQTINITATVTAYLTVGSVVRFGLLNNTDRDYDGSAYSNADVIRFSITKLK